MSFACNFFEESSEIAKYIKTGVCKQSLVLLVKQIQNCTQIGFPGRVNSYKSGPVGEGSKDGKFENFVLELEFLLKLPKL